MAAKKHLHERRGVTFQELGAVLGTREMLRLGVLKHSKANYPKAGEHTFNMNVACNRLDCGTASCIGGTMAMLMGRFNTTMDYVQCNRSASLEDLFYPPQYLDWDKATNKVAIQAIDNWLKDGKPRWAKLLPELPPPS